LLPVVGPGPAGRRTARYTSAEKVVLEAQLGYKLNLCLPVAQRWAFFGILNGRQSDGCIFGRYKEGYAKFYYLDGLHNCDCHLDGSLLCTDAICPLRDRHHGSSHRSKRTGQGRYTSLAPSSEGQIGQIPEGSSELLSQLRIYLAADRRSRAEWDGVALGEPLTRKQGGELLRERFLVQGLEPPDSYQLDELWGRCYP